MVSRPQVFIEFVHEDCVCRQMTRAALLSPDCCVSGRPLLTHCLMLGLFILEEGSGQGFAMES